MSDKKCVRVTLDITENNGKMEVKEVKISYSEAHAAIDCLKKLNTQKDESSANLLALDRMK